MINSLPGVLGLIVQVAIFIVVYLGILGRYGHARAMLYGAVLAVYGYGLLVGVAMLFAVPWQVVNIALALGGALALSSARVRSAIAAGWPSFRLAARRGWGALLIVGFLIAFHVLIAVLKPEVSVDGQLYHGPVLALLVQSGSLWGWSPTNEFAYYTDLTMAGGVNLATFTGPARFDDALQIPHLLVLVLAVNWALSKRFTTSWVRVAFAALIVTAPVIWMQPRILYVDLAYGTAVVIAALLIVMTRRFAVLDLIVAGTAVAAILATKPAGILTSGLLLVTLIGVAVWRRRREGARLGASLGVVTGVVLIPGAAALAFYVRNTVSFGNPVYPVKVELGPVTLPGIVDFSVFSSGAGGSGLFDPLRIWVFLQNVALGMTAGVVKPDYDPRAGGFGHVPLFIIVITALVIVAQLILRLRSRDRARGVLPLWRMQVGLFVLSLVILTIQPATFDSRYVIGPLVVMLTAVLMTTIDIEPPRIVDVCAAALALCLALGQAVWTEVSVYPGLASIRELRTLSVQWQPGTPGNPWGRGTAISWMPQEPGRCLTIAVQTTGGLAPTGMKETAYWATFPYALYGEDLCNRVIPVTFGDGERGDVRTRDGIAAADFAVLFEDDVAEWRRELPGGADCWISVAEIEGSDAYPTGTEVFRNVCS